MPSLLIIFDNGYFTTVSGGGKLLEIFMLDKTIGQYTGRGHVVCKPDEFGYHNARLRFLPFHRCFSFADEDVDKRKCE